MGPLMVRPGTFVCIRLGVYADTAPREVQRGGINQQRPDQCGHLEVPAAAIPAGDRGVRAVGPGLAGVGYAGGNTGLLCAHREAGSAGPSRR